MFSVIFKTGMLMLILPSFQGEDIICRFHNLNANCRYRIDGSSLAIIEASVDKCADPVEVNFHIENEYPPVDWSGKFSKNRDIKKVEGFGLNIELQVYLSYDDDKNFLVKADFDVENQQKAYFLQDKVHFTTEDCLTLNKAGQIAVGCLIGLLIIAGVLLIFLLYLRHKRKVLQHQNQILVENQESPCVQETPRGQPTVRFNAHASQQANQNSTLSHVTFLPNGQVTNQSSSPPV